MQITDWFIDVDTHITEPGDVWTSRLPHRFRDRAPRIVRSDGFETDYPHPVCLFGNVREKIDAALSSQPEEIQRKILFGNAAALYGIGEPDRPTRFAAPTAQHEA